MNYQVTGRVPIQMNDITGKFCDATIGSVFCVEQYSDTAKEGRFTSTVHICFECSRRAILVQETINTLLETGKIKEYHEVSI